MTKPPPKTTTQGNYVSSGVRMPSDLRLELKDSAEKNGRSMNAELIARLQLAPLSARLDKLEAEMRDIKAMVKQILDAVSDR